MEKSQLRCLMQERRKNLTPTQVSRASETIVKTLLNLKLLKKSRLILSYMPYGHEVDLLALNQWVLEQGKGLCLPRTLDGLHMDAVRMDNLNRGLMKSRFGIDEPIPELNSMDIDAIDCILVPGLAFDWEGNRLGHGKGYYDRFLAKCAQNIITIGIAYSFQVFDNIPYDLYDKRMNGIVTENHCTLI